ncbi:GNAT family N-acetyltransferase [Alicyclobacillus tolerans]|uniref:Ribosomal protein S18 acetylase RimI-like enzyme n=1 Tax=Alicyclobacillus tolerans TaxID=90970 RepID=A0ABT9LXM8_9BACL|nr:GNAT family N-acetyltransferase [Alicyclobacillus tengchongensis]MDP9729004.1 ribosomal protein S18 acetylase RimI-like enzyme [Alicyclobacillus tengchongensis]
MMIFDSEYFYVCPIEMSDVDNVVEVYNSNMIFLEKHTKNYPVTFEWVTEELKSMRNAGFCSCKVVDKRTGKMVGIIDYKIEQESYLSLLIVHQDYQNMGYGEQIYRAFEDYAKSRKSQCIRLDVANGYSDKVINFWIANGFEKLEDIKLNWAGVTLSAVIMKKYILT